MRITICAVTPSGRKKYKTPTLTWYCAAGVREAIDCMRGLLEWDDPDCREITFRFTPKPGYGADDVTFETFRNPHQAPTA